jgi:amino acid adenylation domain-containing protein
MDTGHIHAGREVTRPVHERLVHELFEDQARLTPDLLAVVHGQKYLTYAQLDRRANRLAQKLRGLGVGPDRIVALCLERSLEFVIGALGILKAGGAYLPLDPAYPSERLAMMLEDASPVVLLTRPPHSVVLPVKDTQVVHMDEQQVAADDDDNDMVAHADCTQRNLVYVIYTSGSTGRPKGTAMPHRSAVNLIRWQRQVLPLPTGCRVLQFAALSFDVAFQEIFSTLCCGGTLVLLDEWMRRDARALVRVLNAHAVQRLFLPPAMLHVLAEQAAATTDALPSHLRDVITAGEQLRITREVRAFFERLPGCRLHNHYGPTETHVVTALTLEGEPHHWPTLPSIGWPISNARIHLLDERGQPVNVGVPGEIHIGGICVARGYLHQPGLTDQRFVRDPFSTDPEARLYKTGDLGRWCADGSIEYLGRNDEQVKIRGFRVEPGEIEAHLACQEHVRDAAVVARDLADGRRCLVAYVTTRSGCDIDAEDLRSRLMATLPEHMVPSAFVKLDEMPLTPSGKIDRRALPPPLPEAFARAPYEAPRDEIESALARIWEELLRLDRVGRQDHFFQLGGHSLLAMQLVTRIRATLSNEVLVSAVFDFPVLSDLAAHLAQQRDSQFVEEFAAGDDDVEDVLRYVSGMSENNVEQLLRKLRAGGRT